MTLHHPTRRTLRVAACVCLTMAAQYAGAEQGGCTPDFSVVETSPGVFEGASVDESCTRADMHGDTNEGEWRVDITSPDPQRKNSRTHLDSKKGHMRIDYEDGEYGQFGGEWPSNEYTLHIPKPGMKLYGANINKKSRSFSAIFSRKGDEDGKKNFALMKAYIEKLKTHGYTAKAKSSGGKANPSSEDDDWVAYRAKNGAGYFVEVGCGISGLCFLGLYDPKGAKQWEEREAKSKAQDKEAQKNFPW